MSVIILTHRDREILSTLSGPCRLATVEQLARTFWPSSKSPVSDTRKRLSSLKDAGLVESRVIMAHPEIALARPVFSWPDDDPEDLGSVAYRVKTRWTKPLQATRVIIATPEARKLLGARPGRPTRRSETTHDVHLTAVYLTYLRTKPEIAAHWSSGDQLEADAFERVPDAIVKDDRDHINRVIDFAGSYRAGKLKAMHREFARFRHEFW
jgi:hypothetical protein